MTNETTASQPKSIGDDAPKGWEPVYLAWNDQINAWVDVGVAEYLAADTQDRRMAYEPQGAAA